MKARMKTARKISKPRRKRAAAAAPKPQVIAGIKAPPDMQLVSIYLNVKDVDAALDFYAKAFGFKKKFAMPGPDGKSVHGELLHGNCSIMVGLPTPGSEFKTPADLGGSPASAYVYVKDVDALTKRARAAGAKITREPEDMFWGDRVCGITDPEGHNWGFATLKRIVPPSEIQMPA